MNKLHGCAIKIILTNTFLRILINELYALSHKRFTLSQLLLKIFI